MYRTVIKIDGMMCSMCEAHVNSAIRSALNVKKVSSSHKKGETEIISPEAVTEEQVKSALEGTGYRVTGISGSPYVKKGLFGRK